MAAAGERPALRGRAEADQLVLEVLREHADSLLRVARRHSLCQDDAHDAYQRAAEIFLRHAQRLDAAEAYKWIHTVTKHEAMRVRQSRLRLVGSEDVDFDAREAPDLPAPEERVLRFERLTRSAEALQRLKPQELRALWLKAQGHSYAEIAELQGWTYTKVNRCITEGRRSFLERYEGIESGAECRRWEPVISAMVDGEATAAQVTQIRPHLRNCPACRATLRSMRESGPGLAALLPLPAVAVAVPHAAHHAEATGSLFVRAYEYVGGHVLRVQDAIEATAGGKVAAVAASAAAIAGGGVAVQHAVTAPAKPRAVATAHGIAGRGPGSSAANRVVRPTGAIAGMAVARPPAHPPLTVSQRAHVTRRSEFGFSKQAREARASHAGTAAREFSSSSPTSATATAASTSSSAAAPAPVAAPPHSSAATQTAAAEFGG